MGSTVNEGHTISKAVAPKVYVYAVTLVAVTEITAKSQRSEIVSLKLLEIPAITASVYVLADKVKVCSPIVALSLVSTVMRSESFDTVIALARALVIPNYMLILQVDGSTVHGTV